MALLDKPVSMNELGAAVVQDIGAVAHIQLSQEKNELSTVWESMYSKGLGRKVSSQCYYTPEDIERARKEDEEKAEKAKEERERAGSIQENHEIAEKDQANAAGSHDGKESLKDLASVHFERALSSGRAHVFDEGRHYRRRRTLSGEFSNSAPKSQRQTARNKSSGDAL
ncbi:uncharacterized protein LOC116603666 [Nematostella vectensis]|uniref:uncharacterized protein LOC116603666 n=1 Tax=Nematostella vectensis TaxID=45351 RepID=UPI0013901A1F|nr:uncharacterized protein LOC116603666 [Nematostella vectensis]